MAWVEWNRPGRPHVTSRSPERFTLIYEVGPEGIARGGSIRFQVPPFVGGWSAPQVEHPEARGYTMATPSPADIRLATQIVPPKAMQFVVQGRPLVAGDRLKIVYGAGSGLALAGRYAEKEARFWFAVDGDGDGELSYLVDSPSVEVHPGRPSALRVTLPTTARPGETVPVRVAVLDRYRNAFLPVTGEVIFDDVPAGLEMPRRAVLRKSDDGWLDIAARVRSPGIYRVRATAGSLEARSNPLVVSEDGPRVLWGDLHGHSGMSDGTGTATDYFRFARDISGLDIVALTDHDHQGNVRIDMHPELWREIAETTRRFHRPGEFVTLLGYEWTNWIHGHRHVLYFDDVGEMWSSADPATESPRDLWKALEGRNALTFAHHSAGSIIPTNWQIPPDPILEPVTEIVSIHGSSESADTVTPIKRPVEGNFVRDALDMGYRLGFIGSGDTHDGHPGLTDIGYRSGGLAAILSEDKTRTGVLEALQARRVYATNGRRILLEATLGGHPIGSIIDTEGAAGVGRELVVRAVGSARIERIDVVRSGEVVERIPATNGIDFAFTRRIEDLRRGEYLYVRVIQEDGGAAWSSPFFVD